MEYIFGSGSFEKDSPIEIVAIEKEQKARGRSMTSDAGKRQRHAHKTGQTLPQGVLPTLDMGRFSRLFAYCCAVCCSLGITAAYAAQKSVKQCPWREADGPFKYRFFGAIACETA